MNSKIKIGLVIIAVFALVLFSSFVKAKCGDGICQPREERKGSCPEDYGGITPTEPPINKAVCGNGICEAGETFENCLQGYEDYICAQILAPICGSDGMTYDNECRAKCAGVNIVHIGECKKNNYKVKSMKTITENGGNVDWHHKSNKIAIGKLGNDGYFDVWLMNLDGSNEKCITCDHKNLPNKHIGNAAWHPSGEYLVMQVEKSIVPKKYDNKATPGAGVLNDLYIITKDGKKVWELYRVNDDVSKDSSGILHPHFSHNGKKLAWAERIKDNGRPFGEWAIKIADFEFIDGSPKLTNIEALQPGSRSSFYETHTFSPDDSKLLFTGNQDGSLEIYELDIKTKNVKRLTNNPTGWDEHATYSPDGTKILWMSSKDVKFRKFPFYLQTEFWIMDADGNNKKRITYFHKKGHPHNFKADENDFAVVADNSWGPGGNQVIALIITANPKLDKRDSGRIVMIEFE